MKTDKEIVKEVTTICVLYELGGYTAAEAMRMIYKLLTEDKL